MDDRRLFVITVACEKGGVGKTTIATNLAVYLKALHEDLPVTIASFDNHFSIDQMFAIGKRHGRSVAGLFAGIPAGELVELGEYGVQFVGSERELHPPDADPFHLRRVLGASGLTGILILDTRPILDYFTRNALHAADLVLVPVKDRASLVNVASLLQAMREGEGDAGRLWLLPSIIDSRVRLRGEIGVQEFLTLAARERDYQVLDTFITKSPKVEGLATSFSSRIYPVITHARLTLVHQQFRELADFVLQRHAAFKPALANPFLSADLPPGRLRRLAATCPVCRERMDGREGYLYQEMRRRHLGFIHASCLVQLFASSEMPATSGGMLALTLPGCGFAGSDYAVDLHLFDAQGEKVWGESLPDPAEQLEAFLQEATGRQSAEFYRETVLFLLAEGMPMQFLSGAGYNRLAELRRYVLRELPGY
jgi:cellulose biosynthesis protein BcsQ